MSLQRDLPLWARGLVGALVFGAPAWMLHIEVLRSAAGSSVALVALGIVSASSLGGMHVPLGLWPEGPWRTRFSVGVVVGVASAFAIVMVGADPTAPDVLALVDRGAFTLVVVGVVGWGLAWAFVRQRVATGWYGVATAAGVLPFLVGIVELAAAPDGVCLFGVDAADGCSVPTVRTFLFLLPMYAAISLVTLDLTFRRFMIGWPDRADAVLVLASALVCGLWVLAVGSDVPLVATPWWIAVLAAASAGAVYVLSGSLLVASYLTGLVYAATMALRVARPGGSLADVTGPGPVYGAALAVSAAALVGLLIRRRGLAVPWLRNREGG